MVKYKVNLKFKDNGKSLSDIVIEVLKIEIEKKFNINCNSMSEKQFCNQINYCQIERCGN